MSATAPASPASGGLASNQPSSSWISWIALAADSTSAIRFWQGTRSVIRNCFSCGKLLSNLLPSQLRHLMQTKHALLLSTLQKENQCVGSRRLLSIANPMSGLIYQAHCFTYFQVEHLWVRLSPAVINSLGMSWPFAKNCVSRSTGIALPMSPVAA